MAVARRLTSTNVSGILDLQKQKKNFKQNWKITNTGVEVVEIKINFSWDKVSLIGQTEEANSIQIKTKRDNRLFENEIKISFSCGWLLVIVYNLSVKIRAP